jgi:hypothetical protein
MSRDLFCHIQYEVEAHDPYFFQRRDGSKRFGDECQILYIWTL